MVPAVHAIQLIARRLIGARQVRFLLVGGVNTVMGLSIYPSLLFIFPYFQKNYMSALFLAQGICLIVAYILYKTIVFRSRANIVREFARFSSFYMTIYLVNALILPLMVEGLLVKPMIAQTGFTLLTILGSYLWHSRVTFTRVSAAATYRRAG